MFAIIIKDEKIVNLKKASMKSFLFYVFYIDNHSILYYSSFTKSTREKIMKKHYESITGNWKTAMGIFRCWKGNRFMDLTENLTINIKENSYQSEITTTKLFLEKRYDKVSFLHLL